MVFVVFFVIAFIAEIILTINIVSWLQKFDRQICSYNSYLTNLRPTLTQVLNNSRINVNRFHLKITEKLLKIAQKKVEIKRKLLKHLFSNIIIIFLKNYSRQILYWYNITIALVKIFNTYLKRTNSNSL